MAHFGFLHWFLIGFSSVSHDALEPLSRSATAALGSQVPPRGLLSAATGIGRVTTRQLPRKPLYARARCVGVMSPDGSAAGLGHI